MHKRFGALTAIALATTILLSACDTTRDSTTKESSYADEIEKTKIMTFEISVDETNWQTMLDNAADEEYISADVTVNGTTIKNVGIRPKGNSSLKEVVNDDTTDRFSFKIKFDEYVEGQTWKGLDKIVINNMSSDTSYLKEYLSYDIMEYIGVEAPLFAFADISVNGETWGFYLAVEDIDSSYLDRVSDGEGELYKPESDNMQMGNKINSGGQGVEKNTEDATNIQEGNGLPSEAATDEQSMGDQEKTQKDNTTDNAENLPDIQKGFQGGGMMGAAENGVSLQYTDDNVSSYSAIFDNAETNADESDYQRVVTALKNLNEGTDLETYVDVEGVLKYFAAQTVVVNLDSYISNMGHNYYLYENDGQISILPWDYNLSFGGFQSSDASEVVNFPIDTPVSGVSLEDRPLLGKLLEVPEYLDMYHEYLQEIINGYFLDGKFEQTVDNLNNLISEYVKNDSSAFYTYEEYEAAITELKELGVLRAESIQGQLDGTIPSTTEGQEKDSSKLIDASSIDLTSLGDHGGDTGGQMPNGGGRGKEGFVMPEGFDMDTMRQAMEIIGDTKSEELSEEQKTKLYDLGLNDEEINQLFQMPNRNQGNTQNP
jgi:spore coat protein CotH